MSESDLDLGCEHYRRKCKFVTPCCDKIYTCRFCHDENETHPVKRQEVRELICSSCQTRQKVQTECESCSQRFGKYSCLECKLFDDEDRDQFHCAGCGICRVGGRDKFFHCERCNTCLPNKLLNDHRCVENVSRSNCPVCLENIHTSRIPCHIPECGHLVHRTCFSELLQAGLYACPTCQTSMLDMTQLWKYLDDEIEMTPMPDEYKNYTVDILCKDCHKECVVKFHVVGLKCLYCGSYNSCRIKGSPCQSAAGGSAEPPVVSSNYRFIHSHNASVASFNPFTASYTGHGCYVMKSAKGLEDSGEEASSSGGESSSHQSLQPSE